MSEKFKNKSAEELMIVYQQDAPEVAFLAFNELYNRFHSKVYSFLLSKVKAAADADDLLQKVFIKMHESKHLYKDKFKFEQWLFVMARSVLLDHFRASKRYQARIEKWSNDEHSAGEDLPHDFLDHLKLKDDQKELLEMKFIDELSYQEISKILNRPETALRKMVSRLMGTLRSGDV